MNKHIELDMKRLEEIKIELDNFSEKYKVNACIKEYDTLMKEMEIQNLYNMSSKIIYIHSFTLRFVRGDYYIPNRKTNKLSNSKWLMFLDNGNVGPLSMCNDVDYSWVKIEVYDNMRKKLDDISCSFDTINSYWLFEPSNSIVDTIKQIINEAYNEVAEKRKVHEKERLLKKLAELDGGDK